MSYLGPHRLEVETLECRALLVMACDAELLCTAILDGKKDQPIRNCEFLILHDVHLHVVFARSVAGFALHTIFLIESRAKL